MVAMGAMRGGERALKGWLPAPWAGRAGAALGFKKGCPVRPSKGPVVGMGAPEGPNGPLFTGSRARGVGSRRVSDLYVEVSNDGQDAGQLKL